MTQPLAPVRYTTLGEDVIAYRDQGGEGAALLYLGTQGSNQDLLWDEPSYAHFLRRLAGLGRLVTFDRRGSGLSTRVPKPTIESRVEDIVHVLDTVAVDAAVVVAVLGSTQAALVFAASYPNRCRGLILFAPAACTLQRPDYQIGIPESEHQAAVELVPDVWGTGITASLYVPSLAEDPDVVTWFARYERAVATPLEIRDWLRMYAETDVRDVLPHVRAPSLVFVPDRADEPVPAFSRYVADRLANAITVELDGRDQFPFGDSMGTFFAAVNDFLPSVVDVPLRASDSRRLAAILFTDIVASTEHLRSVGDQEWRTILDSHDDIVSRTVVAQSGRIVKSMGDGALALFDGPANAVLAALAVTTKLARVGLSTRTGVHFGEVEERGEDVAGIAVHVASRVASAAESGEVLVTGVVRDLVAGSGLQFADRGRHQLKGLDEPVNLLAVIRESPPH
jgi:class 3 adenylate cyclase/pimeloyl-ACP methyl ester carboxylesterase